MLHLVGGAAMFALAYQTTFWSFFFVMLVYQLAYMPTHVADQRDVFHHVADAQHDFGKIRLWGTIGWIAASWPFVFILAGKTGPELHAALSSIFTVGGHRVDRPRGVLADAAAHAARQDARRGISAPMQAIRLLRDPAMFVLFVGDVDGCAGAPVLFPVDQPVPAAGGARGKLDHAGDERRPDRRDRLDGRARLGAARAWAGDGR